MEKNNDLFNLLRKIDSQNNLSQREMAKSMGFSLGKLNYCLKALKKKGLIKISNFNKNKNKINYIYILTPEGIAQETKLTIKFMKKIMIQYDELKKEIKNSK